MSKALSVVAKPIFMDDATTSIDRIDYVRWCLDVSAAKLLPNTIKLQLPSSELVEQGVAYE